MNAEFKEIQNVQLILDGFRRLLFSQQGRCERLLQLEAGQFVCVAAASYVPFDKVLVLAKTLPGCRAWTFNTRYYSAVYAEISGSWILFFQPNDVRGDLSQSNFNQSIDAILTDDLRLFGIAQGITNLQQIPFEVFCSLFELYGECLAHSFGFNQNDLRRVKAINTCREIRRIYFEADKGHLESVAKYVEEFGFIYFIQTKAVEHCLRSVDVEWHDVATNAGNLPILLHHLSAENLLQFKLSKMVASDMNIFPASQNWSQVQRQFHSKPDWCIQRLNLKGDLARLKSANVITANDVLEHFPEAESFQIFKDIWASTKQLLLIHVPIEEELSEHFGHLTAFTAEKLEAWANSLDGCDNLTHECLAPFKTQFKHSLDGFLVLRKQ